MNKITVHTILDGIGIRALREYIYRYLPAPDFHSHDFTIVMHYSPYCSKYNSIEHRFLSQIHRSWSGASLLSVEDAAQRAALTITSKGLTVHVDINDKTYDIKRPPDVSYKRGLSRQLVQAIELLQWNYLIKLAN